MHRISYLITSAILFVFVTLPLDAQQYLPHDSLYVGNTPVHIVKSPNDGTLHVFCAGFDENYNGQFDEGDEYPSWWVINKTEQFGEFLFETEKKLSFDKFFRFPSGVEVFRPGFNWRDNVIYIPFQGHIRAYDLMKFELIDEEVARIDATSIDFAGGHLLITVSPGANEKGRLDVLNVSSGQILQTIPADINVMQCVYYPSPKGISIALLSNGEYGESNGKVQYGAINHMSDFTLDYEVIVGSNPNHMIFKNGKLYVSVNGDHKVVEIDVETHEIRTFYLGTVAFNGPRELYVDGNYLYVATYTGDFRKINLETGCIDMIASFSDYKAESILTYDNYLIGLYSYDAMYGASNTVVVFEYTDEDVFEGALRSVAVGARPISSYFDEISSLYHVFCLGHDTEQPSWWTIDMEGKSTQRFNFPADELKYPLKPAFDWQNRTIYIPHRNKITSYNLDDFTTDDPSVANIDAVALDFAGSHLLVATRKDGADSIIVLNTQSGGVLQRVYAGMHVRDLKYYSMLVEDNPQPVISLAILTDKDETSGETQLLYGPIKHMKDFTLDFSVDAGRDASHLVHSFLNNSLFTVSETDHDLYHILLHDNSVQVTPTGTYGNIYPKKLFSLFDVLLLPTYNGDIRSYSIDEVFGQFFLEDIVLLPYKIEEVHMAAINMMPIAALFTTPYHADGSISNEVLFLNMSGMSVHEKSTTSKDLIYPNPTSGNFTIVLKDNKYNLSNLRIDVFNQFGQFIFTEFYSVSNNVINIQLPADKIPTGVYYLTISDGNTSRTQTLNVIK